VSSDRHQEQDWGGPPSCAASVDALKSFLGTRRKPDPRRPDERDATWIVEPLFQPYRLGFFPRSGRWEIRTLEGK
jgi:hypothetical protein